MDNQKITSTAREVEVILGTSFQDLALLREAFTHTSYAHENQLPSNERLEFLGDSLLGAYVATRLFVLYPEMNEGDLTNLKASLVEADACAFYVEKLKLDSLLLLGKGEKFNLSRGRLSRHADLFESLLGALYLDQGWEAVYTVLDAKVWPLMQNLIEQPLNQNWKALLQDHTQRSWHITPRYELLSEEGPEHEKIFTVGVFLEDRQVSEGQGRTKKEAEKKASEIAYKELIGENGN